MPETNPEWVELLKLELEKLESRFSKSRKRWNFWYYTSLYGAILLSAFSALTLKSEIILDTAIKNDMAALFATVAAILGTAMTAGSFERRWAAARVARASVLKLQVSINNPDIDPNEISKKMENIIDEYTKQVLGGDD